MLKLFSNIYEYLLILELTKNSKFNICWQFLCITTNTWKIVQIDCQKLNSNWNSYSLQLGLLSSTN